MQYNTEFLFTNELSLFVSSAKILLWSARARALFSLARRSLGLSLSLSLTHSHTCSFPRPRSLTRSLALTLADLYTYTTPSGDPYHPGIYNAFFSAHHQRQKIPAVDGLPICGNQLLLPKLHQWGCVGKAVLICSLGLKNTLRLEPNQNIIGIILLTRQLCKSIENP